MCVEITGTGVGKGNDPISEPLKGVVHDLCGCNGGNDDYFIFILCCFDMHILQSYSSTAERS